MLYTAPECRFYCKILPDSFFSYIGLCAVNKIGDAHRADIALTALSDADCAALDLFLADDEHVGNLVELSLTDFVAYLLAAGVNADSESRHIELLANFFGIAVELIGYRQNLDLLGSKPQRERACKVLGDNADEAR